MSKLGFDQIDERTVRSILNEVDVDQDGQISLEEYLDVAAGSSKPRSPPFVANHSLTWRNPSPSRRGGPPSQRLHRHCLPPQPRRHRRRARRRWRRGQEPQRRKRAAEEGGREDRLLEQDAARAHWRLVVSAVAWSTNRWTFLLALLGELPSLSAQTAAQLCTYR